MSKIALSLFIVLLSASLASTARADLITWGPSQNTTSALDVSLNGTLVTARNPWNGVASSPTVNGVTFTAFGPAGWANGGNMLMATSTSGDAGYDTLLSTARGTSEAVLTNPTGWGGIRLDTLGTLTIGSTYEIQVWFCDQRMGVPSNLLHDRVMMMSSATGAAVLSLGNVTNLGALTQGTLSGPLDADPNNISGAGDTIFGQFTIGTFTRTSADQLWLLQQGSHPDPLNVLTPHINAFQIRELPPEPGTPFCFGDGTLVDHTTSCPCTNDGAPGNGCANSANPAGANLVASGSVFPNNVVLTGSGMPATVSCIYLQGDGLADAIFGDGVRCTGGTLIRLRTRSNVGGASSFPDSTDTITLSARGGVVPGSGAVRNYQTYYRNSAPIFCPPETFNVSSGWTITW